MSSQGRNKGRIQIRRSLNLKMRIVKITIIGVLLLIIILVPFFIGNLLRTEKSLGSSIISSEKKKISEDKIDTNKKAKKNINQYINKSLATRNSKGASSGNTNTQLFRLGYPDLTNTGVMFVNSGTIVSDEGSFITSPTGTSENWGNIYVKGDWINNGAYVTDTGKIIFWGGSLQAIDGSSVSTIYNADVDNSGGVYLNTNTVVSNKLNLINGALDLNSRTLSITNTATTGITYSGGYIVSEKTDNLSKVKWTINTTTGAHVIPFATASAQVIPLTINLTAGNIGDVTVSTYHTGADNLPKPVTPDAVFSIVNVAGADNSANMVDRYWQIDKNGPSGTSAITFTYLDSEIPTNGESTLNSQRYDKVGNRWELPLSGQSQSSATNNVTTPGITAYGPYTLVLITSPLPIELLEFNATREKDRIKLTWITAVEINSDYFIVERSKDGILFESINKVKAAGNSNSIINYESYDEEPIEGISYYRLRQTDFDNSYTYSDIRKIYYYKKGNTIVTEYPNPAHSDFNLWIKAQKDTKASILIIDPLGKMIYNKDYSISNEGNSIYFNCDIWSRGVYHMQIIIDDTEIIEKTIILN